ncbi:hypothetical protein [Mariniblastus fucicola]|nr:hypothetical protein [Mariniblastus fucicola]
MCIFSLPILSVGDTRIFARFSGKGTQFLVYQMTYESENENAMILPIPVRQPAEEKSVRFINLEDYEGFFDTLNVGFPIKPRIQLGCGEFSLSASKDSLSVVEVGSYVASFVPTMEDFDRLDERFVLPKEVWNQLPQYADYGFAVFQLKDGNRKPHPMAFEFETRDESELFFPTVHIHDGEVHEKEFFQHLLYMQHAGFDSRVGGYVNADIKDVATGVIRSDSVAGEFCDIDRAEGVLKNDLLLHRKIVMGEYENVDFTIPAIGHPTEKSFNWRRIQWMWPWVAVAGCIAWFFARRSRLKRKQ